MTSTWQYHHFLELCLILFLLPPYQTAAARRLSGVTAMSERHEQWMALHGRVYNGTDEKNRRLKIFEDNVKRIESWNNAGDRSYTLEVNKFADQTLDEFMARNTYKSLDFRPKSVGVVSSFQYENVTVVPPSVDWRQKGAVTPAKDQNGCGCCWAFSAVAAMEGIKQIKSGKLIPLSIQELVDCDTKDRGCRGGLMDYAFNFVINNDGLATAEDYPYQAAQGTCNTNLVASARTAQINGYEDVPTNSEHALLKAVANQPVSVAIDASGMQMMFYSKGVFTGACGTKLNHGATAVGYGTSHDGKKYWIVKNSWGENWGEDGFIRMQRDVDDVQGLCGIAKEASYPIA